MESTSSQAAPPLADRGHGLVTGAQVSLWLGGGAVLMSLVVALSWLTGLVGVLWFAVVLAGGLAVGFWAVALVVTLIACAGRLRGPFTSNARRALLLAAPGALAGTVVVAIIAVSLMQTVGLFRPNVAEQRAHAAVDVYRDLGARVVCDNGDSGYGVVNRQPWYDVWLEVPTQAATQSTAEAALAAVGWSTSERGDVGAYVGDAPPVGSFAMVSGDDLDNAAVATYGQSDVVFRCDGPDYGETRIAPDGMAFVVLSVRLPDAG